MSKIEVNAIEPQCGTTLTVGASGDTITFPTGTTIVNNGTQTGFGRTGTVDWDTTPKTSTVTAANGVGYFVDTTAGAITVNLPAGVAGDIVAINDYANTAATNNITISANGTEKIQGATTNKLLNINGTSTTLVYTDSTQGWKVVDTGEISSVPSEPVFITATGGTITTVDTDYKVHTFTGPGTFTVSCAGNVAGSNSVDYMVVAGGGSGANLACGNNNNGGGGGAGGYRESSGIASGCYTASPLGACVSALPVSATGYPITVGAGAAGSCTDGAGTNGSNSIFSSIISAGGGGGGRNAIGLTGGSGGGSGSDAPAVAGNTPPVSPPQGQPGGAGAGTAPCQVAGGGGGATQAGQQGSPTTSGPAGPGGNGATSSINATPTTRAGGGGGGGNYGQAGGGSGGSGGGGAGGNYPLGPGTNGTTNTGGGSGASASGPGSTTSGSGGSGIVVIRYKFQ